MTIPIIRLEIEGMKATVCTALTQYAAKMDADIQHAVNSYCESGNLERVVREAATNALDAVVKEEVRYLFSHGSIGRKAVKEAIQEWMEDYYAEPKADAATGSKV
jgi:hypothetical protein